MNKPRFRVNRFGSGQVAILLRPDGWNLVLQWKDFPKTQETWGAIMRWYHGGESPYPEYAALRDAPR